MWCQLGRNSAYANIVQNRQRGPIEWDRHLKAALRKEYFAAADWIINGTKRRFEQPGMEQLVKLEGILASAAE